MYFELQRIQRLANDLSKLIYRTKLTVEDYIWNPTKEKIETDWKKADMGLLWGGLGVHSWFKTTVKIPESFKGYETRFRINTGHEGEWDATNPQFQIYIDGKIKQGMDVNHTETILTYQSNGNETYDIEFLAYHGLTDEKIKITTCIVAVDSVTETFWYDLNVPLTSAALLPADSRDRLTILKTLSEAADIIDLRNAYSAEYYKSLEKAGELLKKVFYTEVKKDVPLVTGIGHTHIDIAWLWTVSQTREKVVRSFSTVIELMKKYPDYQFMSSQPILYQFVKEDAPELYEEIKERIKEGRWEVDGGTWLEPDCNIPSGESLLRQLLKGRKFFKEEFGKTSDTLWLPDVFGYSAALPQILVKSGIKNFMTTKLSWSQFNMIPHDSFMWKGIDGTKIFTLLSTTSDYDASTGDKVSFSGRKKTTTYTGDINANMLLGTYTRYQDKDINEHTMMIYGYGDGGGGPTYEMLERQKRFRYGIPGIPRIELNSQKAYFDNIRQNINPKDIPDWAGELYFEYHRGTYTSMAKNKRYNRKLEILYSDLETMSSIMEIMGHEYDHKTIQEGWDIILLNQFHDIIPGTSIKEVYDATDKEYEKITANGNRLLRKLLKQLADSVCKSKDSILVFNTLSGKRNDLVTCENIQNDFTAVEDINGNVRPLQYIADSKAVFFAEDIPSKGYSVYRLLKEANLKTDNLIKNDTDLYFENKFYSVRFNENFNITSLIEKATQREAMVQGKAGNKLMCYEDRPMEWDNWDIDIFYKKKPYDLGDVTSWEIVENGPVRTCIKTKRQFMHSTIVQHIYLYNDIPRIDFATEVDWKEKNVLLRVEFPLDINTNKATFEIQFGNLERSTTNNTSWDVAQFESCGHKWADMSDGNFGVSLLNDCKYGYSAKGDALSLTLIKSGTYPNPVADIGLHKFTYSIYPHGSSWQYANTQEEACKLNSPLHSLYKANGQSSGLSAYSFVSVDTDNCLIDTIKKAEDGNGYIVRIYEYKNRRTPIKMKFGNDIKSAFECDLMEENNVQIACSPNAIETIIKPYEIKTFRIIV